MSDDKKEAWLSYMAFTTVFFALFATLSTFKGGGFSTRALISQAQASDQWAYYQAKGTEEGECVTKKDLEQFLFDTLPATPTEKQKQSLQAATAVADECIKKYEKKRADASAQAKSLEEQRDEAKRHGAPMGYAVILLQIAIVISSIAGLMKRKELWLLALPMGIGGIVFFVDGFFLFF